jgi:hypothetical protein
MAARAVLHLLEEPDSPFVGAKFHVGEDVLLILYMSCAADAVHEDILYSVVGGLIVLGFWPL